jgi:WD40 repeat protein
MKTIRIFISSPGDVVEERDRARQVVEQLRRRYAGQFDLRPVLWEELPLQADMSFQQGIDVVLSREQGVDIAVFILWSRLGAPLGARIRKPDGSAYRSGTEREFDLMLAARRENRRRDPASDAPKILIYTRKDEASFDERLRGKPTNEKDQLIAQKKLVEGFIQEEFHDLATGTNVRAYHTFDQPVTFSQRLRVHLQGILDALAGGVDSEPIWNVTRQGSPFRGLEAFQFEHNPVFFGREDEVLEVRRALQRKAQEGCAFVLISGASGSGKSSLARAGVVPAVVEYEVDTAVSEWRHLVCTPAEFGGNLCRGLAVSLTSAGVLPELRVSEDSISVLAEGLATAPKATVDQSIRPALQRAAQPSRGAVRLLLLVDQFEEVFTDKRVAEADRQQFTKALEALARSGVVWVLATVRSDFYQYCQRLPALIRLKEGPGQVDLLPPTPDALRRLIEYPARLAGLRFEESNGTSLADRILADATLHAELLPLVSYVLRELFEQRTSQGVLTFAVYQQLGGVEGAMARRAENVFGTLSFAAQGELLSVLRALVSVSGDEEGGVVRQHVPLAMFPQESPQRELVDAFVRERFLATDRGSDGTATVAVTHEALLRVWSRAAQWVRDNRDFLRVRARVAARIKEGSRLLEGDPLLSAARHHLAVTPAGFTSEQAAFIEECLQAVREARLRRDRRTRSVAIAFAIISCLASGFGWLAWRKSSQATAENHARLQLLQHAGRSEQALAESRFRQGSWEEGVTYLARSLTFVPDNQAAAAHFWSAIVNGSGNMLGHPFRVVNFLAPQQPRPAAATDSGNVYSVNAVGYVNTSSGETLTLEFGGIQDLAVSADGASVAVCCIDPPSAQVFALSSGEPVSERLTLPSTISKVALSPSGEALAMGQWGGTVSVWKRGAGIRDLPLDPAAAHAGNAADGRVLITGLEFNRDGDLLLAVTSDRTAWLWNASTQTELKMFQSLSNLAVARFHPDGRGILSADLRGTLTLRGVGNPVSSRSVKYRTNITAIVFSPDGERFATVDSQGAGIVWDTRSMAELEPCPAPLVVHDVSFSPHGVDVLRFSPDGQRLVGACADGKLRWWTVGVKSRAANEFDRSVPFAFDPAGAVLAVTHERGWRDRVIELWHMGNNLDARPYRAFPVPHAKFLCFNASGERLVTAGYDGVLRFWDCAQSLCGMEILGKEAQGLKGDRAEVLPRSAGNDITARHDAAPAHPAVADRAPPKPNLADAEIVAPRGLRLSEAGMPGLAPAQLTNADGTSVGTWSSSRFPRPSDAEEYWRSRGIWLVRGDAYEEQTNAASRYLLRAWEASSKFALTEVLTHERRVVSREWGSDTNSVVTKDEDDVLRRWRLFASQEPAPSWISSLAEFATGWKSDEQNLALSPMSDQDRMEREHALRQVAKGTNSWSRLAGWVLLPPSQRPVSPLDPTTPAQWTAKALEVNIENDLRTALAINPSDPLVEIALSGFSDDPRQAAWMKNRALSHLPADPEVCLRAAELLMLRKDWAGAQAAVDLALKAAPGHPKAGELKQVLKARIQDSPSPATSQ